MLKYILVGLVGALFGALLAVLFFGDVDLLSAQKDEIVVLRAELAAKSARGDEIRLPAGTALIFESQYVDEATLRLRVVTSKLDSFEQAAGIEATYYAD
jgi:hypothetical protein